MKIPKPKKKPWELVFDPEKVIKKGEDYSLDKYRLSHEDLKKWAIKCSEMREGLR
jgi:hypothetical protein